MNAITGHPATVLPVEVTFAATVTSMPHFFIGRLTHSRHEAFDVRNDAGAAIEIVDNVDIAPPVPVVPGDRIAVRGELVAGRRGEPLVHWTHHDARGRHPEGWIEFGGRRYA